MSALISQGTALQNILRLEKKCKFRIFKVEEILESDKTLSGDDFFHAGIIFRHGDCPDDFWQAYSLFLKAVDQNYKGAKRFAAAAFDKRLMYQGKPQSLDCIMYLMEYD